MLVYLHEFMCIFIYIYAYIHMAALLLKAT
jgi:hypothetical protein